MGITVRPIDELVTIEIALKGEQTIRFKIAALRYAKKALINAETTRVKKGEVLQDKTLAVFLALKYGLKEVEGIENKDGTPFELAFEGDKKEALKDECLDALLNSEITSGLLLTGNQLLDGLSQEITDPLTGLPVPGIKIVDEPSESKKKS